MSVASWFVSTTSGSATWSTTVYQVESDIEITYNVISFDTDNTAPYWGPPNDGPYNLWFTIEPEIVELDPVASDSPVQSYRVLTSATQPSVAFVYDVISTVSQITGSASFPFASVERDLEVLYTVSQPSVDALLDFEYEILGYVEDFITVIYDLKTSVTSDIEQVYSLGGYVEADVEFEYRTTNEVESDFEGSYDVRVSAEQDAVLEYDVVTIPFSADSDATITYNVQSGVERDLVDSYNILTFAERAFTDVYRITNDLTSDKIVTYDVNGSVTSDLTFSYTVVGKGTVESNVIYIYSILGNTKQVPNVIGYNLPKATEVLQREGFGVGTTRNVA